MNSIIKKILFASLLLTQPFYASASAQKEAEDEAKGNAAQKVPTVCHYFDRLDGRAYLVEFTCVKPGNSEIAEVRYRAGFSKRGIDQGSVTVTLSSDSITVREFEEIPGTKHFFACLQYFFANALEGQVKRVDIVGTELGNITDYLSRTGYIKPLGFENRWQYSLVDKDTKKRLGGYPINWFYLYNDFPYSKDSSGYGLLAPKASHRIIYAVLDPKTNKEQVFEAHQLKDELKKMTCTEKAGQR